MAAHGTSAMDTYRVGESTLAFFIYCLRFLVQRRDYSVYTTGSMRSSEVGGAESGYKAVIHLFMCAQMLLRTVAKQCFLQAGNSQRTALCTQPIAQRAILLVLLAL